MIMLIGSDDSIFMQPFMLTTMNHRVIESTAQVFDDPRLECLPFQELKK